MKDRYRKIQKKKDRQKGCERIMSKEKERNLEPDECKHYLLQRPLRAVNSSFPFLFHFAALGGGWGGLLSWWNYRTTSTSSSSFTSPTPHLPKRKTCCLAVMKNVKVKRELSIIQLQRLKFGVLCSSDRGPAVFGKSSRIFLSTGSSFIRFHVLLLSYIFQLFTNLEWLPSPGLPACQIDQVLLSEETLCLWACLCMRLPHNLKSDVASRGLSTHLNDLTPLT